MMDPRPSYSGPPAHRAPARLRHGLACLALLSAFTLDPAAAADWKPAAGPLMTRWAKDVSPDSAHPEYPRPQLVRPGWRSLNGLWDYAITPRDAAAPKRYAGTILVPFAIESALSGVMKKVGDARVLWYRRRVDLRPAAGMRVLLHFEAVDWRATVWVNGTRTGEHEGGYDRFSLDITDALRRTGPQEIVVRVWDPTDAGIQPRGKQVREPRGIWYTSVTGIWQTVWVEEVAPVHVEGLKIVPGVDSGSVTVTAALRTEPGKVTVEAAVTAGAGKERVGSGSVSIDGGGGRAAVSIRLPVPKARLWSPDSPFLYDLDVTVRHGGKVADRVSSYFGMRSISVEKDEDGFNRLFLNGEPLFMFGPLDQGWWPDGLYTAPTDEALRYDIEVTRSLGMNLARKHVKVEPDRWYYHCDRLGLLVWQDMPSGDRFIGVRDPDIERSPESEAIYRREYRALIEGRGNHPCIVAWVPFNEGWGQFKTDEILAWTKELDPTRLVDSPSGWADRGSGDLHDIHRYPGPAMPDPEPRRAAVLGEFGGLGLPIKGHLWWSKRNWGYRTYATREELAANYRRLMNRLRPLIGRGLAAAVYTQTTDVEGEVNGLMTYDRAVIKHDPAAVAALHRRFYEPPPIITVRTVVPASEKKGIEWRYTTTRPPPGWERPGFDDSGWKRGKGGFGAPGTPGAVVRTEWRTPDIWIRRTVVIPEDRLASPHLRIHHDEDAEVYLGGQLIARVRGYTSEYEEYELDTTARKALVPGASVLAVHCHQTGGGQYIDVGIDDVTERPRR